MSVNRAAMPEVLHYHLLVSAASFAAVVFCVSRFQKRASNTSSRARAGESNDSTLTKDEILHLRRKHMSKNQSISYAEPLHIVRGDDKGRD